MTDYVAHRRLALLVSPGIPMLVAGVLLHASGSRSAAWPLLILGTLATALFYCNAWEFLNLRRWRRRRCPACGSPLRVDSVCDVTTTVKHTLFSTGVCRATVHDEVACPPCGSRSRFDADDRCVGPPPADADRR